MGLKKKTLRRSVRSADKVGSLKRKAGVSLAPQSGADLGARKKIMDAAIQLFAKKGLDGTSTRDIAQLSGLNLSLISYYFGGKEGLFLTVLKEFAMHLMEQLLGLVDTFDEIEMSEEAVRKMILGIVDLMIDLRTEYPLMAVVMTREKVSGMPNTQEIHEQIFSRVGDKIKAAIVRGQKQGIINKKINPHFFVFCLFESIVGYFCMHDTPAIADELTRECYTLPRQKEDFKNQIALICLEGILK